jgi:hypothetical protein
MSRSLLQAHCSKLPWGFHIALSLMFQEFWNTDLENTARLLDQFPDDQS